MMKYLTLLMALVLTACQKNTKPISDPDVLRVECLDGVNYYLFRDTAGYNGYGYMAPKYNSDGSLSLCEANQ